MSDLVQLSEAQRALAKVETPADAKVLYDRLETLTQYARRYGLEHEQMNEIAEAKLRTARKGGALLAETVRAHRPSELSPNGTLPSGITRNMSSRWQALSTISDTEFEEHVEAVKASDDELTLAGALRFQKLGVHFSSDTGEWSTPQDLFDELDAEFGFTLDVCATKENAKCERHFTKDDDGLAQTWAASSCFMNPPYGAQIGSWVHKAAEEASRIVDPSTVVCLVPARTDTAWWWEYALLGEIRFLKGRLKFGGSDNSAPFPSALLVFPADPCVVWWQR